MPGPKTAHRRNSEQNGRLKDQAGEPRAKKTTDQTAMPPRRTWIWFLGLLLINYFIVRLLLPNPQEPTTVPYTFFKNQVGSGNVGAIYSEGETITGRFITPVAYPPADDKSATPSDSGQTGGDRNRPAPKASSAMTTHFTTILPAFVDQGLEAFLIKNGVEISAKPIQEQASPLLTLLFSFGPGLLFIGFYIWLFRRAAQQGGGLMGGGMMGIGKSKARRYDQEKETKVKFDDVAGIDEAENELVEIVDFLKDTKKYTRLGGTAPKGVLLVGAPGTGKTLLAKAVAGEAEVPFFSMSAAEFVEMIVGVGAARVRDLFKEAREHAPAIIFIDELDAIGRARGHMAIGGSSEQEQTLNQILTEMDGFSSREGIIVLAATNQPDVLDKALLRPGRFDRRIVVNLPDKAGREAILKVHTRNVPLANDAILGDLAAVTPGFSGADIRNLVNEAALLAARRNKRLVTQAEFEDSKDKVMMGAERKTMAMTEEEKLATAYHEAGHAIVNMVVPGNDPLHKVTIIPRGRALGVTMSLPERDRLSYSKQWCEGKIAMAFGGRVAEQIIYGREHLNTGASSDISQATNIAKKMVTEWGMSDKLGPLLYSENQQEVFLGHSITQQQNMSEETAKLIDEETRRIVTTGEKTAWEVLTQHKAELETMAQALMEYETITGEECQAILRGDKIVRRNDDDGSKGPAGSAVPSAGRQPPRPRGEPTGGIDIGPEPQPQG